MRRLAIWEKVAVALALLGCGSQPATTAGSRTEHAVTPVTPTPSAHRPEPVPVRDAAARIEDTLCAERSDCRVDGIVATQPSADGGTRSVLRVLVPESEGGAIDDPPCVLEEFWLVARDARGRFFDHQLLSGGCSEESPEDSWCGIPPRVEVRVEPGRVVADWRTPQFRCMGFFHSHGQIEASLDSFEVLRQSSTSYRVLPPEYSSTTRWDWTTLSGTAEWTAGDDGCPVAHRGPAWRIPRLHVPTAFLERGWQRAGFDRCSTVIDGEHGVALGKDVLSSTRLRALISHDNVLFLEVLPGPEDGRPPASAHLRICFDEVAFDLTYCRLRSFPTCARVALDGKLQAGKIEVRRAPERLRFRVQLPEEASALTVAYVESASRSSVASSQLEPPETGMLGPVLDAPEVGCEMVGGALVLGARRGERSEPLTYYEN